MAEDLEPVNQVFTADMDPYLHQMKAGADDAVRFGEANKLAEDDLHALMQAVAENTAELHSLRDALMETAAAAGHLRDNAAEASHEVKKMGDSAADARTKMDLMGLTGAGTVSRLAPMLGTIGGLVLAATSVAPALLAAGAGLAAIGVAASGAYAQVSPAVQALSKLNNLPPGTKAYASALAMANAQLANLNPQARQFALSIANVSQAFQSWGQTMIPVVEKALTPLLNMLPQVLTQIGQLAKISAGPAASMLTSLLGQIMNIFMGLSSIIAPSIRAVSGLASVLLSLLGGALRQLAPLSVPLITMLAHLADALSGPLIAALHVFQELLVTVLKAIGPLIPGLGRLATLLITDVGSGLTAIIPILGQVLQLLGPAFLQILMDLEPVLANFFTPNSPFMSALKLLPGLLAAVLPLFTGLASILAHPIFAQIIVDVLSFLVAGKELIALLGLVSKAFGLLGLAFEATPVGWVITIIAGLVFAFYELWNHCAAFRNFWKGLWNDIRSIAEPIVGWIKNVLRDMSRWWDDHGAEVMKIVKVFWDFVVGYFKIYAAVIEVVIKAVLAVIETVWKMTWDSIRIVAETVWKVLYTVIHDTIHTTYDVIELVMALIQGHWSTAWRLITDIAKTQIHMVETVIKDVVSGFINLLYNAGRDLLTGLINGIKSMIGAVGGVIGDVAHTIGSVFSGILHFGSPSRVFFDHGVNTILGYMNGVRSMLPQLASLVGQVGQAMLPGGSAIPTYGTYAASAVSPAYGAGVGGGQGAPSGSLIVNVDGKKLFEILQSQLYEYNIRNSGQVTGTVKPT